MRKKALSEAERRSTKQLAVIIQAFMFLILGKLLVYLNAIVTSHFHQYSRLRVGQEAGTNIIFSDLLANYIIIIGLLCVIIFSCKYFYNSDIEYPP